MKPSKIGLVAAVLAAAFAGTAAHAGGDSAAGEKVFNKCKACHAVEAGQNKVGPSLAGVIGRAAGGAAGFKYSDVMAGSGVVWSDEALDQYLANPKEFMPGNKMSFPGLKKEQDRADVIAYLKSAAQ